MTQSKCCPEGCHGATCPVHGQQSAEKDTYTCEHGVVQPIGTHSHAPISDTAEKVVVVDKAIEDLSGYYPVPTTDTSDWRDLETLSAKLHDIYQKEAHRQEEAGIGPVRHYDEYEKLSEPVKEFDRVLARFILKEIERAREKELQIIQTLKDVIEGHKKLVPFFIEDGRTAAIAEVKEIAEGMIKDNPDDGSDRLDTGYLLSLTHLLTKLTDTK